MDEAVLTPAADTVRCWCGATPGPEIGAHYRRCPECKSAVVARRPAEGHFEVADDDRAFYGKTYWADYQRARGFPDIFERARSDLSERCLFWLERLLEVVQPPGRALEIGCGHGAFVRLLQELGFEAVGTELSPWVVDFARRTFGVRVLQGRLDQLALQPGFRCIAAFDVLEHLDDPADLARRCAGLLARDGVLLLQTPCYRGEGPEWPMFQEKEHVHLFSEEGVKLLLERAGFRDVRVRPSLFPYDMWIAATPGTLTVRSTDDLPADDAWRLPAAFRALLDLGHAVADLRQHLTRTSEALAESDADRAARLRIMNTLQARLTEIESTAVWRLYSRLRSLTGPGQGGA